MSDITAERFEKDTAEHELTVLREDGLYRHLRFSSSKNPFYWFELITTPHVLVFRGDGESFVFSRIEDMFDFFRRSGRGAGASIQIQPDYWAEKLESDRDSVKEYSQERFDMEAADYLKEVEADFPGVTAAWTEFTTGVTAEHSTEYKETAQWAVSNFEFGEFAIKVTCSCGAAVDLTTPTQASIWSARHQRDNDSTHELTRERLEPFNFEGAEEWRTHDFGWWFLWACHAIVWGIRQYDAAKAAAAAAPKPLRPSVAQLAAAVKEAAAAGPCWVLRSTGRAALIGVDGEGGHRFVAGFHRRTLTEALTLGLVQLADVRGPVPQYNGGGTVWEWDGGALEGRVITPVGGGE